MDLLQKLTLYDLLGYTLPGCILLTFCGSEMMPYWLMQNGEHENEIFFAIFAFISCGYILGIMIAECMSWILKKAGKLEISRKAFETYHVDKERICQALEKADILCGGSNLDGLELFKRYSGEMYARIQADNKYYRIHNYASAELLYKNMIFVSAACIVTFMLKNNIWGALIGAAGVKCFAMRWKRFYEKKMGYCLGWFLDKYVQPDFSQTEQDDTK